MTPSHHDARVALERVPPDQRRAVIEWCLQLAETVEPWRQLVRDQVARTGRPVVDVVIALSRVRPLGSAAGAVLLAAALDVLEEAPCG